MKVLFLAHSCPYPPNKGDRIRNFHILKHFSSRYAVTLIYPSYSKQDVENLEPLRQHCWAVKTVQLSPLLAKLRCCLSVFGKRPITNSYYYSGRLKRLIDDEDFDMVVVDCSSMAPYVLDVKSPKSSILLMSILTNGSCTQKWPHFPNHWSTILNLENCGHSKQNWSGNLMLPS